MKKILFLFILSFCLLSLSAQLNESFSDNDFTNNPSWLGDQNQFKIKYSDLLQLDGTDSDTSYLSTANSEVLNTEWRFYAKQSFNSSDNNHSRIYLVSNNQNLEGNLNGYFIEFGSSDDIIKFIRQDGNDTTVLIKGNNFTTANSVNEFTFKVICSANSEWEIFVDDQAGSNFISEGSIVDNSYTSTDYFGVFCQYTSSNSTKVYFDDFYIGNIQIDSIAPQINNYELLSDNQILIQFSEALDSNSALNITNYFLDNGIGNPISANFQNNQSKVILNFANNFPLDTYLNLSISNIKDLNNNVLQNANLSFVNHIVSSYEIVINEILADPSPVVLLAENEYLEIYNNSNFPIDMSGWKIIIGSSDKLIEDLIIESDSFVIFGDDNSENALSNYGNFYGLSSFSLTNGGTSIKLVDANNAVIHQVTYDDSWYKSATKSEGGWSLEMIDPNNPCGGIDNWKASEDPRGGSPGKVNSVLANNPDTIQPELLRAAILNPLTLKVYFSEKMDTLSIQNPNAFLVGNGIGNPQSIKTDNVEYKFVELQFSQAFQNNTIYTLSINDTLTDCVGNTVNFDSEIKFAYSEIPDSGDIAINEVLFNPKTDAYDFVELVNKSTKIIDLKFVNIGRFDPITNNLLDKTTITKESYLFFPGDYIVITENKVSLKDNYNIKYPENIIQVDELISLPDDEGNISVISTSEKLIEAFNYNEDMHFELISDAEGISLERVNFNYAANDNNNWHSASSLSGFATPTYINSQFSKQIKSSTEITIEPDIFSPDNDGYNDILKIKIDNEKVGQLVNIRIYNSSGRQVKELETNALIGDKGIFIWDGITDDNEKAGLGIYIIFIEIIDDNGNTEHHKISCTLGGKL